MTLSFIARPAQYVQHATSLAIFICGAWWWRNVWLRDLDAPFSNLYFMHHMVTSLAGLALLAWVLAGLPARWRMGRGLWLWWAALVALGGWMLFSAGEVLNAGVLQSAAGQWLFLTLFVLASLRNGPPPKWVAGALVAGMVLAGGLGIAQTALQHDLGLRVEGLNLREFRLDPSESGVSVVGAGRYLRPHGLSAHPNLWAGGMVLGFFAALPLWKNPRYRPLAALLSGLAFWGIGLSFSRAALGATVVGLGVFAGLVVLSGKARAWRRPAMLAGILLLGLALIFTGVYADLLAERYGLTTSDAPGFTDYSGASRGVYLAQARDLIPAHFWRGVGAGNFAWESAALLRDDWRDLRGNAVHHIYYLAWVETGIIGAALYGVGLLGGLLLGGWRAYRGRLSPAQMGLLAGCAAWLAIGWFDHYLWTQLGHQLLFWGALAAALAQPNPAFPRIQE